SLCLDAFTIALNEASSERGSYMSTMHLQLASLKFCIACRGVSTLRVTVDRHTPRRLWAAPAEQLSMPMNGGVDKTRVPSLRARGVRWMACADTELMSRETNVLANVEFMEFDRDFNADLDDVIWPTRL
ncbi:unnamed protein product, partial [Sphacelaria rigidula]